MYAGMYQEYLETEVLSAEPVKLVQMLYRGAIDAIGAAQRALAAGNIPERARLISKATAILNELALSLDHSKAPDLCRNLVELYDYMSRRLIEANINQVAQPLFEVEGLLNSLLEAWVEVGRAEDREAASNVRFAAGAYAEPAAYQHVSYAW